MRNAVVLIAVLSIVSTTSISAADISAAIDSGYVDWVGEILREDPELLNTKDSDALTPLNRASYRGQVEIVRLLLGMGADASIGDIENSQPIHNAAVAGHTNVLEVLIEAGVDIDVQDANGNTALIFSLIYSRFETAGWLMDAGADLSITNNRNVSPLIYAALRGRVDILRRIVSSGADINQQAESGRTALSFAVGSSQMETAEYLLQSGADTEIPENYGRTPLLWVARENGDAEMAALLIKYGADINAEDKAGDTPLVLASWRGFKGIVDLLLESGAKVDSTGENSEELLNYSVEMGLERLFFRLEQAGVNLEMKSRYSSFMLMSAAMGGSAKIVSTFLNRGFDVGERDFYGWTPLHYAAWKGRTEVARLLTDNGADIDARSFSGLSPYNLATDGNRDEVISLLIASKVDRSAQQFPEMTGPYFGQDPPGEEPQLFLPDIITTDRHGHSSVAFSPDGMEAYWSAYFFPSDSGYAEGAMMFSEGKSGQWTIPDFAPFTDGLETDDDVPVLTKDGNTLYFLSRRPDTPGGSRTGERVWVVERTVSGWGEPYTAPGEINDLDIHWQLTISDSGTLYIQGDRSDSYGLGDIYRSGLVDGEFSTPENVGSTINTDASETTPYIAPDESYLLFASGGHQSEKNNIEIYVSFRKEGGQWSSPVRTGLKGLCPLVTHDGKYLFYNGTVDGIRGIYWVEASLIEDLRAHR